MNKRWMAAVSVAATVMVLLAGCGSSTTSSPSKGSSTPASVQPTPAPAKKVNDTVVYGGTAEISGTDPHSRFSLQDMIALRAVFEPLLNVNKQGKFEPVLAESWSVSTDQKTWTFKLRQGVIFADGKPFTSKAVKATLDRVLKGKALGYTFLFAKVASVETPDEKTVVITTKK